MPVGPTGCCAQKVPDTFFSDPFFPGRIVFLDSFPRMGGAERNLVDLLARLDRRRFAPVFVTSAEGELAAEVRKLDVPVHLCPLPTSVSVVSRTALSARTLAGGSAAFFDYLRRLSATVRALRPRLVWSNSLKDHVFSACTTPLVGKPVVWHLMDYLEKRVLRRFVEGLARATRAHLITNSRFTADQFPRLRGRTDRVRVVYEGLDLSEVDRARRRAPAGGVPAGEGPVIAQVGAICPEKGQELLVRALPAVARRLPDVSCWIVGEEMYATARHRPGYRARLERLARELGVADRVHFLGWRTDVVTLIERTDLVVNLTDPRLSTETFGRTLVEAMACEKPVVAVRRGGPCETVLDGVTGVLFDDYTVEVLAGSVLGLLSDARRARRMGQAGRRRVEEHFTVGRYVHDVETCLDDILAGRGLTPRAGREGDHQP